MLGYLMANLNAAAQNCALNGPVDASFTLTTNSYDATFAYLGVGVPTGYDWKIDGFPTIPNQAIPFPAPNQNTFHTGVQAGMANCSKHVISVRPRCANCGGCPFIDIPFAVNPQPPIITRNLFPTENHVDVFWTPALGCASDEFEIEVYAGKAFNPAKLIHLWSYAFQPNLAEQDASPGTLAEGTLHRLRIRTKNTAGSNSAYSTWVDGGTFITEGDPPAPVAKKTASVIDTCNRAHVSWTASQIDTGGGYQAIPGNGYLGVLNTSASDSSNAHAVPNYFDTANLRQSTNYYYHIKMFYIVPGTTDTFRSQFAHFSFSTPAAPSPSNVHRVSKTSSTMNVSFNEPPIHSDSGYEWIVKTSPTIPAPTTAGTYVSGTNFVATASSSVTNYIFVRSHFKGSNYSNWGQATALSIELTDFDVSAKGTHSSLVTWTTQSERNSAYIDIEHSTNGSHYSLIGRVAAAGISSQPLHYSFVHNSPVAGINYYRLKLVDQNWEETYSPNRFIRFVQDAETITLYPNPIKGKTFFLLLSNTSTKDYSLTLFDVQGRIAYSSVLHFDHTNSPVEIALPTSFSTGMYHLELRSVDAKLNQILVVQ